PTFAGCDFGRVCRSRHGLHSPFLVHHLVLPIGYAAVEGPGARRSAGWNIRGSPDNGRAFRERIYLLRSPLRPGRRRKARGDGDVPPSRLLRRRFLVDKWAAPVAAYEAAGF